MENFDINEFERNINYNYSISASAGTGKTHNMVNIVKTLVDKGIDIENILIVTYTEKAAGELKDKIKKAVTSIDINKSHIGTIHSFCNDIMREFYYNMSIPSNLNVISEDSKMRSLYESFIREKLYNNELEYEDIDRKKFNHILNATKKLYLDKEYKIDESIVSFNIKSYDKFYHDLNNRLSKYKNVNENEIKDFLLNCSRIVSKENLEKEVLDYYEEFEKEIQYVCYEYKNDLDYKIITNNHLLTEYDNKINKIKDDIKTYKSLNKKNPGLYNHNIESLETENEELKQLKSDVKKAIGKYENYLDKFPELQNDIIQHILSSGFFDYDGKKYGFVNNVDNLNFLKIVKSECGDEIVKYADSAIDFYKLWLEEKRRNKWMTFDDMLREVRESVVSSNELINKLRDKYKYALIDEFQDTNQLQWDIFKRVFLDSDRNHIIVVGDRKQSIYSFQGADLTVYEKAVKDIVDKGGIQRNLPDNHRSSESMINAYNRLFEMGSFKSLDYQRVGVGEKKYIEYNGKEISGLGIVLKTDNPDLNYLYDNTLCAYHDQNGLSSLNYSAVNPYEFAKKSAEMIIDFCSFDTNGKTRLQLFDEKEGIRNVSFKDFMVLARYRSEFLHFENELKKVGIPYIKYKDDALFKGTECAQWVAIFNAILKSEFTGKNRNSFRKALFTKFFGKSLKEISNPCYERDDNPEMDLILKWKSLANEYRYDELINSIIIDSHIEERLGSLSNIQSLTVFKQIGDYCLNSLLNGETINTLMNNLINLSEGDIDNNDNVQTVVAKGTDFDCVELMTIHASKGLDRPIVFIVGGEKQDKSEASVEIYHDNETDKSYITLDKNKYKDEKNREKDRLFYVAYTRASHLFVVPYYESNKDVTAINAIPELIEDQKNSNNKLFDYYIFDKKNKIKLLKDEVQIILEENKKDNSNQDSKEDIEKHIGYLSDISKSMTKHIIYKHSYSSLSSSNKEEDIIGDQIYTNKEGVEIDNPLTNIDKNAKCKELEYLDIDPIIVPNGFPKGAGIGTTLHEIFERYDFSSNNNEVLNNIIRQRFKENNIKLTDEFSIYVNNMVDNVLHAKFPIINGSNFIDEIFYLNKIDLQNRKSEIEYNFSDLDNNNISNYYNGEIDLLFKRDDYYSIVDWKSDIINDEDLKSYNKLEDLRKRVDSHYSIQRVLYSYCLIKWLKSFYEEETEEEIFNKHFGGIYYVFLRGCIKDTYNGIYAQTWNSWSTLENEFKSIIKKIKGDSNNE